MADDGIDGLSRSMDQQPTRALSEFVRRGDTMTHFYFQRNASAVVSSLMCSLMLAREQKVLHWSLHQHASALADVKSCMGSFPTVKIIATRGFSFPNSSVGSSATIMHVDVQEKGDEGQNDEDLGNNASIGFSFSKLKYRIKNLCTQLQVLQVRIGRFLFGFRSTYCVPL